MKKLLALLALLSAGAWAQVVIAPTTIPNGIFNVPYSVTLTASGATAPYTFVLEQGILPPGLTLSSSGLLSGTPTSTGGFSFLVRASSGPPGAQQNGFITYSLNIVTFVCPDPNAGVGESYSSSAFVIPTALSFALTGGALPPGFNLSGGQGVVSGTAAAEGVFSYTLTASLSGGGTVTRDCNLFINSVLDTLTPRTTARLGVPYRSAISAYGGVSPYSHTLLSGSLPPGLSLNGSSGLITGTPSTPGSFTFTARTNDGASSLVNRTYTITVLGRPEPSPIALRCPLPSGIGGQFYSSALSISSGVVTGFSITQGALPSGVTMNAQTGALSGSGSSAEFASFTATATLAGGGTVSASCNIDFTEGSTVGARGICPDQTDLVLGEPYASPVTSVGSRRPLSFSLYQTVLPAGLSLNPSTGLVSGTPTTVGNFLTAFTVADNLGFASQSNLCDFRVAAPPPISISTLTLPGAQVGLPYSANIVVVGGIAPLSFQVSGSLPPGLTLNPQSGLLSGTPQSPGTFNFLVLVTDVQSQSASRSFSVNVFQPDPLRFVTSSLSGGTVGTPYSQSIDVAGGAPPYAFRLAEGSVPGLTLSGNRLGGTPTVSGAWPIQVEVSDSAGGTISSRFTVNVAQGAFRVGCPSFTAELNLPFDSSAVVLGGTPPYQFSIREGSLPTGISLGAATGAFSGRPTTTGNSVFTLGVTDSAQQSTAARCGISIVGGALRLLTTGPILTRAGTAYSGSIEAGGGQPPYRFGVLGNPAPGLNLAENGTLGGTASRQGDFPVTIEVRDAAGLAVQRSILFRNAASNLSFVCPEPSSFTLGSTVNASFALNGGVAPYTLRILSGALPAGLTLGVADAQGRVPLTGRPTAPGDFALNLRADDSTETNVTRSCTLRITGQLLSLTTDGLPNGQLGVTYSTALSAQGGLPPYTFGLAGGAMPPGLAIDAASGALSGMPTRTGVFSATYEVRDANRQSARRDLTITVEGGSLPLTITTESPLSDAVVGRPYSQSFDAIGGTPLYLSTTLEGTLPPGLSFNGSITGTPTATGQSQFTVTVRDSARGTVAKVFTLRVVADPALNIVTETLPDGVLGEPYGAAVAVAGGTPPYTWSLTSGSIPPGLTFNASTGNFGGTSTAAGQFSANVLVTDAAGAVSRRSYSFEVRPAGVERLEISTATLPAATLGRPYGASLNARGGQEPYRWELLPGGLADGLTFNAATGAFSGTPTATGTVTFIAVVTDSLGLVASRAFTFPVMATVPPGLALTGLPEALAPNANAPFGINVTTPLGVATTGVLTLRFTPDSIHNTNDPSVRFSNGTRSLEFTIPATGGAVVLPPGSNIQTGTLAGTITITTEVFIFGTVLPGPSQTITIRRGPPVITAARLTRSGGGLEVRIEGFTLTRALSEARITFTFASDVDVTGSATATVNVAAAIQSWFATAASIPFGGQFGLTLPFTVTGDAANVTSVSVQVTNSEGASNTVTAQ